MTAVATDTAQAKYKNANLSTSERVADLLARMTLEEKVAQLRSMRANEPRLTDDVVNDSAKMDAHFKHGIGMMNPEFDVTMEETIERRNALQKYLTTRTRLGIPVIFLDEAHHGLLAPDADMFPHGLGIASSWDLALVEKIYRFVAAQTRLRGCQMVLSPVIDVTRDPRWGRTGETPGEDPFLTGKIGAAMVKGFQGGDDGKVANGHVAATLKHFVAHGESEGGINQGPANYSMRILREVHMEPFKMCIEEAKPAAVMASYTEVDGIPAHANPWLLKNVLRDEWKFNGVVVSDWWGVDQLWNKHHVAADEKGAAQRAFDSGVTIDLPYGTNYVHLYELVREGKISEAAIDTAVSYILALKFELGLFEETAEIDVATVRRSIGSATGRSLALEAALSSMVLLKNEGNLLPLKKEKYKKIALLGPMAEVNYLGDYSGIPHTNISLLEGLREYVGDSCEVVHAPGVLLTKNADKHSRNNYQHKISAEFATPDENQALIAQAMQVARDADVIIVAVGENEQLSREAGDPERYGDMSTLDLVSQQDDLVKAAVATGKPVVVYLAHARPLSINWIADNVPAIVDGWFAGQEAGVAFARILFGDSNPSAKLTISYPRSAGHLPVYYNHKPSAKFFHYVTGDNGPLFPFGHGLSYTTFSYSKPRLSNTSIKKDGSTVVEVEVINSGSMAGSEIVQMYIHQKVSSATRPVKELKGFTKIALKPGEKQTIRFDIGFPQLAFWTANMKFDVEPGTFEIMVGGSSVDVQTVELAVVG